jgi:hypothetical protein
VVVASSYPAFLSVALGSYILDSGAHSLLGFWSTLPTTLPSLLPLEQGAISWRPTFPNNCRKDNANTLACGNGEYIKDVKEGVGYCNHPDLKCFVSDRMCCKYWDHKKVKRNF